MSMVPPFGFNFTPEQLAELRLENKQGLATGIVISFTSLAFMFVTLRYATRILLIKCFGAEDWAIGLAMVRCSRTDSKQIGI